MSTMTFQRVYIWQWPVRLYHWINALCVAVLVPTGFLIGWPPALLSGADASGQQLFGTVRLLHFSSGFVLFWVFVLRMYWMFAGNQYSRWHNFLPLTPRFFRKQIREAVQVLRTDLLQIDKPPKDYLTHNALAAWAYSGIFALTLFQAATGLAMYAPMSAWWFPQLFAWIVPLMGGDAEVRMWHHVGLWGFVVFTIVHLYLAVFHEVVESKGELSSIVGGTRFVERP